MTDILTAVKRQFMPLTFYDCYVRSLKLEIVFRRYSSLEVFLNEIVGSPFGNIWDFEKPITFNLGENIEN
jgi:hypothetical protein